ncbi:major facilitator superfamily transporter [Ophiostoma piceae UAMH 11346]|uniref:DASH complex subunit DAD3 n=1 Tax=Ophiostoma piceae (strain UAMH 11346) TaxID=1262450 RepID=S3BYF5_OPHP1|nr:major facilitator superfamily transporter [Ophiostoma piceae UAMH 11346]
MDDTAEILSAPTPQHGGSMVPGLASHEDLSPKEQAVLEEYERLAENMKRLATLLGDLAGQPATETMDGLRELERKTSLVFTLLKASVYSIVLQHQLDGGE